MSPKCKVSFFFFLFKLFTKSSWKSERQLPLQGLKSIKTTTEQLKQSEREKEKEKETTSNIWHLVLSTGFPRAPLGIESKIYWQTHFSIPGRAALAPLPRGGSVQSDCGRWARPGSPTHSPGLAEPAGPWGLAAAPPARRSGLQHGQAACWDPVSSPACTVLTSASTPPVPQLPSALPQTVLSPALRAREDRPPPPLLLPLPPQTIPPSPLLSSPLASLPPFTFCLKSPRPRGWTE